MTTDEDDMLTRIRVELVTTTNELYKQNEFDFAEDQSRYYEMRAKISQIKQIADNAKTSSDIVVATIELKKCLDILEKYKIKLQMRSLTARLEMINKK